MSRAPWSLALAALHGLAFAAGCASDSEINRVLVPPNVEILSPEHGALFRQGAGTIELRGRVSDSADPAPDLQVVWSLDHGAVTEAVTATAAGDVVMEVDSVDLDLGTHEITLSATDQDGETATDTLTIDVGGPFGAPVVEITDPEGATTVEPGTAVTFQGQASDTTDPPEALVLTWTSSLDGELAGAVSAGGQSIVVAEALSPGVHAVTLTAVDTDGEVGSDTVEVVVGEEDVEKPPIDDAEPGDLVFSEMMINPQSVDDEVGEWVELFNTASYAIDIAGYFFRDDDVDTYTLTGPLLVPPGGYVVLCASTDPAQNGGVSCDGGFVRDSQGAGLALANGPDEVVLTRPDAVEIDWLHYDDSWFLPAVAIGVDPAYLDSGANDDPTHWCSQVTVTLASGEPGTPGAANDPCFPAAE